MGSTDQALDGSGVAVISGRGALMQKSTACSWVSGQTSKGLYAVGGRVNGADAASKATNMEGSHHKRLSRSESG